MKRRSSFLSFGLALGTSLALLTEARASRAADETPAHGEQPPRFGSRGTVVIGTNASAWIDASSENSQGYVNLFVQPALDYFVVNHLSIGGSLNFGYSQQTSGPGQYQETSFGAGTGVGYDIPLSDHFSVWPKVSVLATESHATQGVAPTVYSATTLGLGAFAPILYHPVPHFFIGFGPFVDHTVYGNDDTTWGGNLTLGGWL